MGVSRALCKAGLFDDRVIGSRVPPPALGENAFGEKGLPLVGFCTTIGEVRFWILEVSIAIPPDLPRPLDCANLNCCVGRLDPPSGG